MVKSQSRDVNADNEESLRMLMRAVAFSQEQFSLILVRCNYGQLRERLIEQLRELCSVNCRERVLQPSVKSLYQVIIEELREEPPSALIISGLELIDEIEALLITANNARDEFRKNFPFPLVLWVTDAIEYKLRRVAPDFTSWAAAPIEFEVTTEELVESIEQAVEQVFTKILEVGAGRFINNAIFNLEVGSCRWWELASALQDLQNRDVQLESELAANIEFVLGQDANDSREDSWRHYERSLALFQEAEGRRQEAGGRRQKAGGRSQEAEGRSQESSTNPKWIEREGCVLFYMGLWWRKYAVEHRTEYELACCKARNYFQQALEVFEQHNRPDLVAKFINSLGEVLLRLKDWDELEIVAKKALKLHQGYPEYLRIAHDYDLLAEVELSKSAWVKAKEYAEQALEIITELEQSAGSGNLPEQDRFLDWLRKYIREFSLLSLGRSLSGLGEKQEAIKTLETAITLGHPQYDPSLYIQIMQELRSLYFEQGEYLKAFEIKRERQSIEQQYGFRAFIGAGRLQPKQRVINPALPDAKPQGAVTQEIAASGRQQDVNRLVERMARNDHKLTVIQGQSGVGKSSIVQAGLIPVLTNRAIDSRDVLPVLQQVYTDWVGELSNCLTDTMAERRYIPALQTSLEKGDINSEQTTIRQEKPSAFCPLPPAFPVDSTAAILEQLHRNADHNLLTVLIFDQFEEFFFICKQPKQRRVFYEFLRDCLDIHYVKVILSLREDYLHYLLECNNRLVDLEIIRNNILDKNILYYLGNFSPADARAVIQALTEQTQFYLEPELIEQLVEDLAGELGEVRPIELQVIGAQLQTENITTLEQYRIPGSKEVLVGRFLEEVVKDCGPEHQQVAKLVLYLLTDENNTRPLKTRADLELELEVKAEILDLVLEILVKSGIVLRVPASPAERYQLVHDYLVPFVRQQQWARLIAELEKAKEEQQHTQERLNRFLKRRLREAYAAGVVLTIMTASAIGFWRHAEYQVNQRTIAELKAINSTYQALFLSNDQLGALVNAVKAGRQLKQATNVPKEIHDEIVRSLRQALYKVKEYNRLKGHQSWVSRVSFSQDGEMIASASADGTIKLWSHKGKEIKTLTGHSNWIYSVTFSPDDKLIASAGADKTIKLWNLKGEEIRTFKGHSSSVRDVTFSPDGELIASAGADKTIKLWNLKGEEIRTFKGHSAEVTSVSFSRDSETIASASADRTVKLWNLKGEQIKTLREHSDWVYSVNFSPNSNTLVSASADGTIKLWSSDGNLLKTQSGHSTEVTSASFSSDGQTLVSTSTNGTIKLWNLKDKLPVILHSHGSEVTTVSFSPDGQMIASADTDKIIKLWRYDSNEKIKIIEDSGNDSNKLINLNNIKSVSVSQDGQTIATVSASADKNIKLWNLEGEEIGTLRGHSSYVNSVSFSPNSQTIASASVDRTVKIWSLEGKEIKTLTGHGSFINSVSFSPDGKTIASTSVDRTVKIWSLDDGKLLNTIAKSSATFNSVSFSPDGQTIASTSDDGSIQLWSLDDGNLLKTIARPKATLKSFSFSPDGKTIATGSVDGTIKLWSLDGKEITTFQRDTAEVLSVSFSPDGKRLISISSEGIVNQWNLDWQNSDLEGLIASACNWLDDYLKTNSDVREPNLCPKTSKPNLAETTPQQSPPADTQEPHFIKASSQLISLAPSVTSNRKYLLEESPTDTISVQSFNIEGNTVFSDQEIAKAFAPFTAGPFTWEELTQAADKVTQLYLEEGYLTSRAILVDQELIDGVVTIRVIEGELEEIEIKGVTTLRESYIRDRIALAAQTPLNTERLEKMLRLLRQEPFLDDVSASLRSGTRIGKGILIVELKEAPLLGIAESN
ncbi:MAG: hypothetical protein F6K58_01705 [Symploca sp. SIO2E9]|nr:hypothetical protein [Symploca sp. SIO2E9]